MIHEQGTRCHRHRRKVVGGRASKTSEPLDTNAMRASGVPGIDDQAAEVFARPKIILVWWPLSATFDDCEIRHAHNP